LHSSEADEAISANWQSGSVVNLHEEMLELALRIVGKCLFDLDVQSRDQVKTLGFGRPIGRESAGASKPSETR